MYQMKPMEVRSAIAHVRESAPENLTVQTLTANPDIVDSLAEDLSAFNVRHVIPMTHKATHAMGSVALYAGDGIVTKLTDETHLEQKYNSRLKRNDNMIVPGVLPPIERFKKGAIVNEVYPWIDRHNVKDSDVGRMKETLAIYNLRFKPGDNKRGNIGILPGPGRKLAVLDPDAVELLDPNFGILANDSRRWEKEVHSRLYPLYEDHQKKVAILSVTHPISPKDFHP